AADQERRRLADPEPGAFVEAGLDAAGVLRAAHTGVERPAIQADRSGQLADQPRAITALSPVRRAVIQRRVHLAVLALFRGACGGVGSNTGAGMQVVEREVPVAPAHLAGGDQLLPNRGKLDRL